MACEEQACTDWLAAWMARTGFLASAQECVVRAFGLGTGAWALWVDAGAGEVRVFFDITLPLLVPAILSGMLLSFAMSLDDVIISIFVTGVNVNTLPIKVYTQIKTGVTPEINALCTLMLGATIILVVLSNVLGKVGKPRTGKQHKETAERSAAPVPAQPQ